MTGRAYYGRRSEKPSAAGLRHRLPKEAAAIEANPEEKRSTELERAGKLRPIPLERLRRMGAARAIARREAREAAAGSDADQTA